jgi:hypothetical protein
VPASKHAQQLSWPANKSRGACEELKALVTFAINVESLALRRSDASSAVFNCAGINRLSTEIPFCLGVSDEVGFDQSLCCRLSFGDCSGENCHVAGSFGLLVDPIVPFIGLVK